MSVFQREEVLSRLESAVCQTPGVTGAVYFGSIAQGCADCLSDIDLLVRCAGGTGHDVVAAVHGHLDIVLYRPFGAGRRPSGRYWFGAADPFLRLDVSFHHADAFDEMLRTGGEFVRPPFQSLEIGGRRVAPTAVPPPMSSVEEERFARVLRNFQESAKAVVRGRMPKRPLTSAVEAVPVARPSRVRQEAWDLYERSWEQLEGVGLQRVARPRR